MRLEYLIFDAPGKDEVPSVVAAVVYAICRNQNFGEGVFLKGKGLELRGLSMQWSVGIANVDADDN
jgi:hypothetical protein